MKTECDCVYSSSKFHVFLKSNPETFIDPPINAHFITSTHKMAQNPIFVDKFTSLTNMSKLAFLVCVTCYKSQGLNHRTKLIDVFAGFIGLYLTEVG